MYKLRALKWNKNISLYVSKTLLVKLLSWHDIDMIVSKCQSHTHDDDKSTNLLTPTVDFSFINFKVKHNLYSQAAEQTQQINRP